jgi:hypothetical protein
MDIRLHFENKRPVGIQETMQNYKEVDRLLLMEI